MIDITRRILSLIFWIAGAGLYIFSFLTTFWVQSNGGLNYFGLFKHCSPSTCTKWGKNYNAVPMYVFVPRTIMLFGAFMVFIGMVVGTTGLCRKNRKETFSSGMLSFAGGFSVWTAASAFTVFSAFECYGCFSETEDFVFHYSYYFAWAAGFMFILSGICIILGTMHDSKESATLK